MEDPARLLNLMGQLEGGKDFSAGDFHVLALVVDLSGVYFGKRAEELRVVSYLWISLSHLLRVMRHRTIVFLASKCLEWRETDRKRTKSFVTPSPKSDKSKIKS